MDEANVSPRKLTFEILPSPFGEGGPLAVDEANAGPANERLRFYLLLLEKGDRLRWMRRMPVPQINGRAFFPPRNPRLNSMFRDSTGNTRTRVVIL